MADRDEQTQQAIDLVAQDALWRLVDDWVNDLWGDDYPEIGEHDWEAIEQRLRRATPQPDRAQVEAAYEHLASRAAPE